MVRHSSNDGLMDTQTLQDTLAASLLHTSRAQPLPSLITCLHSCSSCSLLRCWGKRRVGGRATYSPASGTLPFHPLPSLELPSPRSSPGYTPTPLSAKSLPQHPPAISCGAPALSPALFSSCTCCAMQLGLCVCVYMCVFTRVYVCCLLVSFLMICFPNFA